MPDRPSRDGRYSLPGEARSREPSSSGRIPTTPGLIVPAKILQPESTGLIHLDRALEEQARHGARIDRLETEMADLRHAKERDSQHELQEALDEANELLKKKDEAARHWTRWAAQILVTLLIGALLLWLGKAIGAKHGEIPRPAVERIA